MANELRMNIGVTYANGAMADTASSSFGVNQNTLQFQGDVITVSSSAEADLGTSNITTLGWLYLKNLDPTNFVKWGPKSGGVMVAMGRLKAGESVLLRLEPGITLRWIADTASVKVQTKIYAD